MEFTGLFFERRVSASTTKSNESNQMTIHKKTMKSSVEPRCCQFSPMFSPTETVDRRVEFTASASASLRASRRPMCRHGNNGELSFCSISFHSLSVCARVCVVALSTHTRKKTRKNNKKKRKPSVVPIKASSGLIRRPDRGGRRAAGAQAVAAAAAKNKRRRDAGGTILYDLVKKRHLMHNEAEARLHRAASAPRFPSPQKNKKKTKKNKKKPKKGGVSHGPPPTRATTT